VMCHQHQAPLGYAHPTKECHRSHPTSALPAPPAPGYITVCFIVCKTTSELECTILTTLYFAGAENIDN
jgi:hypothetical protein